LASLKQQTIFSEIEVVFADNQSKDDSFKRAKEVLSLWNNAVLVEHENNLGFCLGNNKASEYARGKYLFFLNCDTWLEPECLQILLEGVVATGADAATPLMLNYNDQSIQSTGGAGFDIFGLMSPEPLVAPEGTKDVFVAGGCSYLIDRMLFNRLGGFDPKFFMYCDEMDLSWKVWASGGRIIIVPDAKLHHRGAADVNPQGGDKLVERRTSDSKRYYTNRNGLLLIAKNGQDILLLLLPTQIALLLIEAIVSWVFLRRWSHVRRAYLEAFCDLWRFRSHVASERLRIKSFRRRSDWALMRFFRVVPNRVHELKGLFKMGVPKVDMR
jgi:GT2 family glycosyltransferase